MIRAQSAERRVPSVLLVALSLLAAPLGAQARPSCALVAARALPRGHVLSADDIAEGRQGSARCAPRSALVGSQTRRVVSAGEVLREPAVMPPNVIESGQPVSLLYEDGGVQIRLSGVAANAAPVGGRVTVRVDVRRRLQGVAVAPGVVRVK
jgi:flagellar basal body P-ring formation protein FlgA